MILSDNLVTSFKIERANTFTKKGDTYDDRYC